MTPLIKPKVLIKDTWRSFLKNWDTTVKISAWYLLIACGSALAIMLNTGGAGSSFLGAIIQIICAVATIYLSVKIYKTVLMIEDQKPVVPVSSSVIWKSAVLLLLAGLAVAIPLALSIVIGMIAIGVGGQFFGSVGLIIGSTIGLVILAILLYFLALRFCFVQMRLVDQPTTIKEAFVYSWNLTKGRVWSIFGRAISGNIVFGLFAGAIALAAIMIVSIVSGVDIGGEMAKPKPAPSVKSITELIQGVVMGALLPLFYGFRSKLYREVEKTSK